MFDFGLRLKQLRESKNITQEGLAKRINRSKSVISGYENNIKTPPIDVLISLAVIYNVSLDYIVGLEKKEMTSIERLSESQKIIINNLINEFCTSKLKTRKGLSENQRKLLSDLIVEFIS